ncbi:hypothetical protein CL616_02570 [archaeon]|nr:hypothetical protein [archaeon]|tara:strand:- start:1425 stop:1730 length:306 start_codon:yes stop_codon:yes gene_type:complete
MKLELFSLITILILRVSVLLVPEVDVTFFNVIVHHFWFGIPIFVLGYFLRKSWILGVGLGFMIDQLFFLLLGGGGDIEYWGLPSMSGVLVLVGLLLGRRIF